MKCVASIRESQGKLFNFCKKFSTGHAKKKSLFPCALLWGFYIFVNE